MTYLYPTDPVSLLHAAHHVPQPGVCHQQIWRSTLPADQRVQIYQVPGVAHSGACKESYLRTILAELYLVQLFLMSISIFM